MTEKSSRARQLAMTEDFLWSVCVGSKTNFGREKVQLSGNGLRKRPWFPSPFIVLLTSQPSRHVHHSGDVAMANVAAPASSLELQHATKSVAADNSLIELEHGLVGLVEERLLRDATPAQRQQNTDKRPADLTEDAVHYVDFIHSREQVAPVIQSVRESLALDEDGVVIVNAPGDVSGPSKAAAARIFSCSAESEHEHPHGLPSLPNGQTVHCGRL